MADFRPAGETLATILSAAHDLEATALDAEQRALVERIVVAASPPSSDARPGEAFEVERLVADAVDPIAVAAHARGIDVFVYVDPAVPARIDGDAAAIRELLEILTANALRFTERGEIVVRTCIAERSPLTLAVRFEVSDSGVGIDEDDAGAVIAAGASLARARELAGRLGGTVGATGEPGIGATFWFTGRFARPAVAEPRPRLEGTGAVIVSEDETFAQIVSRYATAWGMVSARAVDAVEAIAVLQAPPPGAERWIAVVDVDRDAGDEIAAALRAHGELLRGRVVTVGDLGSGVPLRRSELAGRIERALA